MELFIHTDDAGQFLSQLSKHIQTEIDSQMSQTEDDDSIYIGCQNFYFYILITDVPSFACIEEAFHVALNLDIDIEIYQKSWSKGIADLRAIVKWFSETFSGDMVLLSNTSELLALRRSGEIIKSLNGTLDALI